MFLKQCITFLIFCLLFLVESNASAYFEVSPTGETEPVPHRGDSIDDPALWLHPSRPEKSLILGTDKQQGIKVYSLKGKLIYSYGKARYNNIDIRYDFPHKRGFTNIIAATRHDISQVEFFTIEPKKQKLVPLGYHIKPTVKAYGLCFYKNNSDRTLHLFVTGKNGNAQHFKISDSGNKLSHKLVRTISISSKNEGCVADDELGYVYIAEEHKGIWKIAADGEKNEIPRLIGSVEDNVDLAEDIEGLALYIGSNGEGYLLASVQGLDSFAIFDRKTDRYLESFTIIANQGIDEVSHTDGIEVISLNLGSTYRHGLMIVQDDIDRERSYRGTQNFKLISWKDIMDAASFPFKLDR